MTTRISDRVNISGANTSVRNTIIPKKADGNKQDSFRIAGTGGSAD